jgi:hypothetical protein
MKTAGRIFGYLKGFSMMLLILCAAQNAHSKTTGETSVQFDGFSFFNALDDSTCKSMYSHQYSGAVDPNAFSGAGAVTIGTLGPCHDPLYPYPVLSEGEQYVAGRRMNFYPSLILRSGNNILKDGDTICLGDTITVESNITGDYYLVGGGNDCPPISFILADRMEQVLDKYLAAHMNITLSSDNNMDYPSPDEISSIIDSITPAMQGEITDPLSGLKAYGESGVRECVPVIYAGVMCTPNMQAGEKTITPRTTGKITINASYSPQCVLLNPRSYSLVGGYYGSPGIGLKDHNRVYIKPAGWSYEKGDLSALPSYKDAQTTWLEYLDKNALMDVSLTVNVVDTLEKPKLDYVSSSMGENDGKYVIRAVLKNNGNAKALIDTVSLNLKNHAILYKPSVLEAGAESDILAATAMNSILSLSGPLTLTVQYRSDKLGCLKDRQMKDSYALNLVSVIKPVKSAQTYSMEVTGSCDNQYYSCSGGDDNGIYNLGYKCYNKDPYYDPSVERFVLGYELPQAPLGMQVFSAVLNYAVQVVSSPQDLIVYDAGNEWSPETCAAGGDICARPYCPECALLHSLGTNRTASVRVTTPGSYAVDVTESVRSRSTKGKISFQTRGGKEDLWNTVGINSCKEKNAWDNYDLLIRGTPVMILFYS